MSDIQGGMPEASGFLEPGKGSAQLVYVLYLATYVIGFTPLLGVLLAYINRGKLGTLIDSHYTYAIRTFWLGLLYSLIAIGAVINAIVSVGASPNVAVSSIIVGVLFVIALAIWWLVRCVIGLYKVSRGEPIANPQSWLI